MADSDYPAPDVPDHLASLATDIGALRSDRRHLSQKEVDDLATVKALNGSMAYLERVLGIEQEVVEAESWNFDTSVELLELGKRLRRIPFGGETAKLFDVRPSFKPSQQFSKSTSKGKEREIPSSDQSHHPRPDNRTLFNRHPMESKDSWLRKYCGASMLYSRPAFAPTCCNRPHGPHEAQPRNAKFRSAFG